MNSTRDGFLDTENADLTAEGRAFAGLQTLLASPTNPKQYRQQVSETVGSVYALAAYAEEQARAGSPQRTAQPGIARLEGNARLLRACAIEIRKALPTFAKLPFARGTTGLELPRIIGVAQSLLHSARYQWSLPAISSFIQGFQLEESLTLRELWALPIALKQVLLDQILTEASGAFSNLPASDAALDSALQCLQQVTLPVWANVLEPLVPFEHILAQDPAQVYSLMDFDSREHYRAVIERLARRSAMSEVEVARTALALATSASQQPAVYRDPRSAARCTHVGYYLVDRGVNELRARCGFLSTPLARLRSSLLKYPDDFYLGGIQIIALLVITAIVLPLVPLYSPFGILAIAFLFLLLPVSQGAVELMNHTITAILKPQPLPKLDFSKGVPEDCKTLVVVPTLLLNEQQVRDLVGELEVRSLANQDRNIHYALLTDLPDSVEKPRDRDTHPLVLLAGNLIDELNQRYATTSGGGFLMLHRHRIFNPRQGVWMGWERKRGKLLDLNRLIMGGMDCFPFKAGDATVLSGMRYVLTLDSDTKLPRDSVRQMVGAIAHPLNRAILDPRRRIVTEGYGILQPRVGITVHSVARSRLAAIYSGQTGFDIYTRAVSDVYQDLYGEGIFTGKGLYEIQILHEVLDRRFPQNSLLSHDLIEGAYARVGLLTDVEVMDDYPSHYSAQNRRKHRWVRGDWQILRWLLNRVPNDAGQLVQNPTSIVSRWKIFDNLRRSLVEPATLLLLVAGWLWLPGSAGYWTIATLLIVFVPVLVEFLFSVVRAALAEESGHVRQAVRDSLAVLFSTALNFVFLAHQTLLMFDAILRSLVRSFVTGNRLLEWETAAEAELGGSKHTPVEITMRLVPWLSIVLALLVFRGRQSALPWALPILTVWAMAKPITLWLNRSPHDLDIKLSDADKHLLRKVAWRTWLYFAHFARENNHGIIPDNVQQNEHGEDRREALRFSPTNAGLQLNARQAAVLFGYLTLPEYVEQTLANLRTLDQIPKWQGHLLNWYTTDTLQPIAPYVVSTVDSGNLLASLCSLRMGTLELLRTPILPAMRDGLLDVLNDIDAPSTSDKELKSALTSKGKEVSDHWLGTLLTFEPEASSTQPSHVESRLHALRTLISSCLPWLHPAFAPAVARTGFTDLPSLESYTPESTLTACQELLTAAESSKPDTPDPSHGDVDMSSQFVAALHAAEHSLQTMIANLNLISEITERLFQSMDYRGLLDPYRRLLSIGFDTQKDRRLESCYDLLASESRTAMFLAIGKGDILQETWFKAGRKTALVDGNPVLLSWTGTMFEYMMPTLWMQTSPETLLAQSLPTAVQAQRDYVADKRMPWGISEACHSQRDAEGNYQYHAFGVPALAVNPPPEGALVIAPYATVLTLEVALSDALANLRKMESLGWLGEFGFYESADYSKNRQPQDGLGYVLVRSWMAHHQGMSLLALANTLAAKPFQRWFHSDPRVRATELLLHEKPIQIVPAEDVPPAVNISFRPASVAADAHP